MAEKKIKTISLIGISKGKNRNSGREIIHTLKKDIVLKPNDPLLFFIQNHVQLYVSIPSMVSSIEVAFYRMGNKWKCC